MLTASAAFAIPMNQKPDPERMAKEMHPRVKEIVKKQKLKVIVDEADLLSPGKRDAIGKVLQIVRNDPRPDGGAQFLEGGDSFQGAPYQNEAEREVVPGALAVGARVELTIEGEHMKAPGRKVMELQTSERFGEALYVEGSRDIRLGHASARATELVKVTSARHFTEAEDLDAVTLYGSTQEVMERDLEVSPRRAARLGHTIANGGVYVYDAKLAFPERASLQRYTESELNPVRAFGLEKQVFYIGKRVLVVQKGVIDSEDDDEGNYDGMDSLQFDDGKYAHGNAPGAVVGWEVGKYIEVKVDRRPPGAAALKVPLQDYSRFGVTVPFFGLKPEADRVVDLSQGMEWSGPVHVVAKKIYGCGKLYVAMTRAKKLANLKVSDVEPTFAGLRKKLKSNWRALNWMMEMGRHLPEPCRRYATSQKRKYDAVFG